MDEVELISGGEVGGARGLFLRLLLEFANFRDVFLSLCVTQMMKYIGHTFGSALLG